MGSAFRLAVTRILLASLVLALFFVMPTFLAAQDVASITGVVTDPSGAVVPGVEVTLTNPQTGVTYQGRHQRLGFLHNSVKSSQDPATKSNSGTRASSLLSSLVFT